MVHECGGECACRQCLETFRPVTGAKSQVIHMFIRISVFCDVCLELVACVAATMARMTRPDIDYDPRWDYEECCEALTPSVSRFSLFESPGFQARTQCAVCVTGVAT